jgi:hypothetical protein
VQPNAATCSHVHSGMDTALSASTQSLDIGQSVQVLRHLFVSKLRLGWYHVTKGHLLMVLPLLGGR